MLKRVLIVNDSCWFNLSYLEPIMMTDNDFNKIWPIPTESVIWVPDKQKVIYNLILLNMSKPDQSSIWHKTASEVGSVHCWSWLKAPGQSIAYTQHTASDSDCSCKFYNGALFPTCHFCNPIIITYLWCFQPLPVSLSFHITHISWQKYFHLQIYKSYSSFSILYFDTDNTVR